jgi:hypothetical protein
MSSRNVLPILIIVTLVLSSCSPANTATPPAIPTNTTGIPTLVIPTSTLPQPTATLFPTATLQPPTATPGATATMPQGSNPSSVNYIDDRSTPSQVIVSFYNAINRKEYLRAYSYYTDPATTLGSYTSFANGYNATASVDLVFGQITGDPGMSQVYYTVPVILKATSTTNSLTNYSACYVVHETNPDVYGAPPISPMGIAQGSAQVSSLNASDASVLASACSGYPVGGNPPFSAFANGLNIDKSNFVDNRSGPIETVSSFLNALNLKQYVRAYSYFQAPASFPGPYDPFAAGYSDTSVITVTFGTVQSEGAAGSLYYKVPLATIVLTTTNTTQTFVGCYTLRLSQPTVQGVPPFQPMGIVSGKFNQVTNGSDINALLPSACN